MNKSISLILPLYNEEDNIEQVVSFILDFFASKTSTFEIILVNDGSTDRTPVIIEELSKDNKCVRTVHHPANRGYSAALESGFKVAQYETVVFMDADGQFDTSEIEKLLRFSKDYDIVAGYREKRQDPWYRIVLGKVFTWSIFLLFGVGLKDINCGFKALRKSMLDRIEIFSTGALINAEIFVNAKKLGYSVKEIEVTHFSQNCARNEKDEKQLGCSYQRL